jgi:lipopolysaccharide/colanic/teichoic acid biosynthesis glycosyltransferase
VAIDTGLPTHPAAGAGAAPLSLVGAPETPGWLDVVEQLHGSAGPPPVPVPADTVVPSTAGVAAGCAVRRPTKRVFDVVGALLALILLSPVLALAALAIKLTSAGPVIYRQRRVGWEGRPFEIWKFRTMSVGAEHAVIDLRERNAADGLLFKVERDPRVTPVGRVLRRLSVDELPQLVNVLRGQMSLVGPRPLAVDPESFAPGERGRHAMPPGITGYWQVSGGNSLTYEEMIRLDLAYVQGWTLWLDLLLLARTIPALVRRKGPW